jgi:Lar family restriction alleviation protein
MSEKLKLAPCPFCGSDDIEVHRQYVSHLHWLSCQDCRTDGPAKMGEADAIAAWNTRPQPSGEGLVEALREAECWLTAALECKTWHWDPDQRVAATDAQRRARQALAAHQPPSREASR